MYNYMREHACAAPTGCPPKPEIKSFGTDFIWCDVTQEWEFIVIGEIEGLNAFKERHFSDLERQESQSVRAWYRQLAQLRQNWVAEHDKG